MGLDDPVERAEYRAAIANKRMYEIEQESRKIISAKQAHIESLEARLMETELERARLSEHLQQLHTSLSWKITGPLRSASEAVKKYRSR